MQGKGPDHGKEAKRRHPDARWGNPTLGRRKTDKVYPLVPYLRAYVDIHSYSKRERELLERFLLEIFKWREDLDEDLALGLAAWELEDDLSATRHVSNVVRQPKNGPLDRITDFLRGSFSIPWPQVVSSWFRVTNAKKSQDKHPLLFSRKREEYRKKLSALRQELHENRQERAASLRV